MLMTLTSATEARQFESSLIRRRELGCGCNGQVAVLLLRQLSPKGHSRLVPGYSPLNVLLLNSLRVMVCVALARWLVVKLGV